MRLSLRVQKLYFSLATCCTLAGAVAMIVWGLSPVEERPEISAKIAKATATNESSEGLGKMPTREDFARLWDRPLRRALYDPPPPKVEAKQLPPLRVELLGTIIEDANSMAMVRSDQGGVQYKRVGDAVGPTESTAKVVEIGADSIVVQRAEERVTLKVQSKELR